MHRSVSRVRCDVFDFIDDVQRLTTTAGVTDAMRATLGRFGLEFYCFNFLPDTHQTFADVLLAAHLPNGWLEHYLERQFVHDDPSLRHCRRTRRPYRWFKDCSYDPEREPRAVEVVQRASEFGLLDGWVIPIATLSSRIGHVWMGGRTTDVAESDMPSLHLMALYAFDRVRRINPGIVCKKPGLTSREREVLTWVALGKSAWEIGEILKISERTVEWHVENTCRKLDAVNRTQAIAIALRDRIIQP